MDSGKIKEDIDFTRTIRVKIFKLDEILQLGILRKVFIDKKVDHVV